MHISKSGLAARVRAAYDRKSGKAELEGAEAGFTLIELMVVLLIMAILLAIAIPTFLGVKGGAQDKAAESNLNTALTSAKAYFANNGSYGTAASTIMSALGTQEPELKFTTTVVTPGSNISVDVSTDGNGVMLAAASQSGSCFAVADNSSTSGNEWITLGANIPPGDLYASWKGTTALPCSAATAEAVPAAQWAASFPTTPTAG